MCRRSISRLSYTTHVYLRDSIFFGVADEQDWRGPSVASLQTKV